MQILEVPAQRIFPRLNTLFAFNFLIKGLISTIFEVYMGIDNQKKISFTLLKNISRFNLILNST